MSQVFIPLLDNSISIAHRVTTSVVRDLCKRTGFAEDIEIVHLTETGNPRRIDSPLTQNKHRLKTKFDKRVYVKSTDRYMEETSAEGFDFPIEENPIIVEPSLGIKAVPLYVTAQKNLEITFRFNSKTAMDTWCEIFALKAKNNALAYEVDVSYEYGIPNDILLYLKHVYSLLETRVTETEKEFLERVSPVDKLTKSNWSGTYKEDVVYESQSGVVGWFDDAFFYNSKEESDGFYSVRLNYNLEYLKVTGVMMMFPLIVHNQLIDTKFIDAWIKPIMSKQPIGDTFIHRNFHKNITHQPSTLYQGDGGKRYLEFDDFFPANTPRYLTTLLLTPIQVNPVGLREVIDLNDMANEGLLDKDVLEAIKENHDKVTTPTATTYTVTMYTLDERGQTQKTIEVSDKGVITTLKDMDTRKRYYLKVAYLNDLTRLQGSGAKELIKNRTTTINQLKAIKPDIKEHLDKVVPIKTIPPKTPTEEPKKIAPEKTLTPIQLTELIKSIKTTNSYFKDKTIQPLLTTENLTINS